MKRFSTIFIIVLSVLVVAGCVNTNKVEKRDNNKKEEKKNIEHPDLAVYELNGNVKSVKWYFNNFGVEELGFVLAFDENGMATKHWYEEIWDEDVDIVVKRDSLNRISEYSINLKGGELAYLKSEYAYDSTGQVASISSTWYNEVSTEETMTYGNDKRRTKSVSQAVSEDGETRETIIYEYTGSDTNGNWTERKGFKTIEEADGTGYAIIDEGTLIERREIEYYR